MCVLLARPVRGIDLDEKMTQPPHHCVIFQHPTAARLREIELVSSCVHKAKCTLVHIRNISKTSVPIELLWFACRLDIGQIYPSTKELCIRNESHAYTVAP
mmetsp:Transcript_26025/g.36355  ORF Transcript_26025/g.36355 Transcript_26025/m.36355 type:complete len:101 (-) Transcript_26025:925-1227(-)